MNKSSTKGLNEDLEFIYNKTDHLINGLSGKTIFIAGGTGFIGKWFLEYFLFLNTIKSIDFKVIVLSRDPENFIKTHQKYNDKLFTFIRGNVISFDYKTLPHCDIIIHAATDSDAKLNDEQPLTMIETIIIGTRKILEYAVNTCAEKTLYLSSGAVYGSQPDYLKFFPECYHGSPDILSPSSAYSEAKRLAELLCACYHKQYKLQVAIARCFAFVGPYLPLNKHYAIGNFINDGLESKNIIITGNGVPLRSYMYSGELLIWLLHILFRGKSSDAYNVGSDQAISIRDLAILISTYFPNSEVEVLNKIASTDRNQNYIPDITKCKTELGLELTIDLETAIHKTINFYKKA